MTAPIDVNNAKSRQSKFPDLSPRHATLAKKLAAAAHDPDIKAVVKNPKCEFELFDIIF